MFGAQQAVLTGSVPGVFYLLFTVLKEENGTMIERGLRAFF